MATERKSLLSKYHDILQEKLEGRRGEFLYRGQENVDWKLRSGAVRRIFQGKDTVGLRELIKEHKEDFDFCEENLRYHEDLLEQSRLRGWYREVGGRELKDLELLAKLQHHGAATCLLDFTTRFDVALWFACQKAQDEKDEGKDGMVFVVGVDAIPAWELGNLCRIESNDLKHNISEILRFETRKKENENQMFKQILDQLFSSGKSPRFWYWHPETLMGRMLSQESRFLFGLEDILHDEGGIFFEDIQIKKEDKEQLLVELKRHYGLSRESVVSDVQGFAIANNHRVPLQRKTAEDYMKKGMKNLHMRELLDAIQNLDKVIKSGDRKERAFAMFYRSATKIVLGADPVAQGQLDRPGPSHFKYIQEAIRDCDELIAQQLFPAEAYFIRSVAHVALLKFENARSDLREAWDLCERHENQGIKKNIEEQMREIVKIEQAIASQNDLSNSEKNGA